MEGQPGQARRRGSARPGGRRGAASPGRLFADAPPRPRAAPRRCGSSGSRGLRLRGEIRPTAAAGIAHAQAFSFFLVNQREPVTERGGADEAFAFGVELEVACADGLVPRPNLSGQPGPARR